jgi:hypothetical protein
MNLSFVALRADRAREPQPGKPPGDRGPDRRIEPQRSPAGLTGIPDLSNFSEPL